MDMGSSNERLKTSWPRTFARRENSRVVRESSQFAGGAGRRRRDAYDHEIRPEWGQDAMHNQI
jgi:hypothetical protein